MKTTNLSQTNLIAAAREISQHADETRAFHARFFAALAERIHAEARKLSDAAMHHGTKHGLDDAFWDLAVRATTEEFDAERYAMEAIRTVCPNLE